MNLFIIARKNIKKNFSLYGLYIISIGLVLMCVFCFASFALNPIILEKIFKNHMLINMICMLVSIFRILILVYGSYINILLLRQRMKELGTYIILGFSKKKIIGLLIIENSIIYGMGFLLGVILGEAIYRISVILMINILGITVEGLKFSWVNIEALGITALYVGVLIIVINLSSSIFMKNKSLLSLMMGEKKRRKEAKINVKLSEISVVLIVLGYIIAIDISREKGFLWHTIGYLPMIAMSIVFIVSGTILGINHAMPYIMLKLKDNKQYFYNETNIIILPKFLKRIRSSAKVLVAVTLISTIMLCILGGTLIAVYYPKACFERTIPAAFEFQVKDELQLGRVKAILQNEINDGSIAYKETRLIQVKASSTNLPYEYTLGEKSFKIIKNSDYNILMKLQGNNKKQKDVLKNECILVKYQYDKKYSDIGCIYSISNKINLKVKNTTLDNPIGFANAMGILVVSDEAYEKIAKENNKINKIISIYGTEKRGEKKLESDKGYYKKLAALFEGQETFQSAYQIKSEYLRFNGPLLIIIVIATIVFFMVTGSLLYFNNISGSLYDKGIVDTLQKVGYSQDWIKLMIRKEVLVFFCIPYIAGIVHTIFILQCVCILMPNLMGNSSIYLIPQLIGIIIYTVIYYLYYTSTKRVCYRINLNEEG